MTFLAKRSGPLLALALAAFSAFLLVASGPATADPSIASKQAQAQAVLAQIQQLDSKLGHATESYNLANIQLSQLDADLKTNGRHLVIARTSLGAAQTHIAQRLRALYINGDSAGAVEVILGAKSLDDLLDRIDIAERVGGQDAQVLKDVRRFRNEVRKRGAKLRSDRVRQTQVVADRAAQKRTIEAQLAERQRLVASIKDEIARMQAAEARRQAQLEAQARARLAAEAAARASARQQALEISSGPVTDFPADGTSSPPSLPAAPPARYGGVVGIAMQYLGTPYVWGGAEPVGLRLLGVRDVRLRAARDLAAAQRGGAVRLGRCLRLVRPARAGRPRVLRRPRPRGDLHRRGAVHPLAAHGRRRQDLESVRLVVRVDLRRREARHLGPGSAVPS